LLEGLWRGRRRLRGPVARGGYPPQLVPLGLGRRGPPAQLLPLGFEPADRLRLLGDLRHQGREPFVADGGELLARSVGDDRGVGNGLGNLAGNLVGKRCRVAIRRIGIADWLADQRGDLLNFPHADKLPALAGKCRQRAAGNPVA
jgi:hypothetical protein